MNQVWFYCYTNQLLSIQQLEDGLLSTMSRHWGQIKAFISFLLLRWGAGVHLAQKKPVPLEQAGCLRGDTAQHSTMSHIHTGPERQTRRSLEFCAPSPIILVIELFSLLGVMESYEDTRDSRCHTTWMS